MLLNTHDCLSMCQFLVFWSSVKSTWIMRPILFSYRSLVAHGFAVDEEGKKMSKSVGNVVDPETVIGGGKVILIC